jgi:hypothetical protein
VYVQTIGKSFVPVAPTWLPFAFDAWHLGALVLVVVTARTVQGMARARSGQAPAWPLVADRVSAVLSTIKHDFAYVHQAFSPVLVVLLRQSCLMWREGRTRTLSGPSPD